MKRKNLFFSVMSILVVLALAIGLSVSCKSDDDGGGGYKGPPAVGDLTDFPEGSIPAETEADVDAILLELKKSYVIDDVYSRINDILYDYRYSDEYTLSPTEDNDVLVSGSKRGTVKGSSDSVNKLINLTYYSSEGMDFDEIMKISLNQGDTAKITTSGITEGESTNDITNDGVTILKGCSFVDQFSYVEDSKITKGGSVMVAEVDQTNTDTSIFSVGFTVDTPVGCVKIIFDSTVVYSNSWKGVTLMEMFMEEPDPDEYSDTYSGSLKIYGTGDGLLKTININKESDFVEAKELLGFNY